MVFSAAVCDVLSIKTDFIALNWLQHISPVVTCFFFSFLHQTINQLIEEIRGD